MNSAFVPGLFMAWPCADVGFVSKTLWNCSFALSDPSFPVSETSSADAVNAAGAGTGEPSRATRLSSGPFLSHTLACKLRGAGKMFRLFLESSLSVSMILYPEVLLVAKINDCKL